MFSTNFKICYLKNSIKYNFCIRNTLYMYFHCSKQKKTLIHGHFLDKFWHQSHKKLQQKQIHLIPHTKHMIPNKMKTSSGANIEVPKSKYKWWRGEIEDVDKPVPEEVTAYLYFISWTYLAAKTPESWQHSHQNRLPANHPITWWLAHALSQSTNPKSNK